MRQLCDSIMKLNPCLSYGEDFSTVALAIFLSEVGFQDQQVYDIYEFTVFLYRFYADNDSIRKKHCNKMINELFHYQPSDFYEYTKGILTYVEQTTQLIILQDTKFRLTHCPENISASIPIVTNLVQILASKYLGNSCNNYSSKIMQEEFRQDGYYIEGSRIFNRAREKSNYCFLCDEDNPQNLCAVRINANPNYEKDMDNYLILCKGHGAMYLEGSLIIGRNGYPYVYGERMYEHIEIGVLKVIRQYLTEMERK